MKEMSFFLGELFQENMLRYLLLTFKLFRETNGILSKESKTDKMITTDEESR